MDSEEKNLEKLLETIWNSLNRATVDTQFHFRYPVLLTLANEFPQGRTVVLREVNSMERRLSFFTHGDSPKAMQIMKRREIGWNFYDHIDKIQIRIDGYAKIISGKEQTEFYWDRVPEGNKKSI